MVGDKTWRSYFSLVTLKRSRARRRQAVTDTHITRRRVCSLTGDRHITQFRFNEINKAERVAGAKKSPEMLWPPPVLAGARIHAADGKQSCGRTTLPRMSGKTKPSRSPACHRQPGPPHAGRQTDTADARLIAPPRQAITTQVVVGRTDQGSDFLQTAALIAHTADEQKDAVLEQRHMFVAPFAVHTLQAARIGNIVSEGTLTITVVRTPENCQRHLCNWFALMPCAIATPAIDAPACRLASTALCLNSRLGVLRVAVSCPLKLGRHQHASAQPSVAHSQTQFKTALGAIQTDVS